MGEEVEVVQCPLTFTKFVCISSVFDPLLYYTMQLQFLLYSTVASGLNSLAAVTLVDIIRPWRTHRMSQNDPILTESTNNGTGEGDGPNTQKQDQRDTILSKILSKSIILKLLQRLELFHAKSKVVCSQGWL